jgi:hypothetical protein
MLRYEKLVRHLILIFVLFNLCSAQIPSKGYFIFPLFTTNTCETRIPENNWAPITSNEICLDQSFGDLIASIKLLDYNPVTKVLNQGIFLESRNCSGSPINYEYTCDGTCKAHPDDPENLFYRCNYNDPDQFDLTYAEYTSSCQAQSQESSAYLDSGCVALDGKSLKPAGYDISSLSMYSIFFLTDERCSSGTPTGLRELTCDGTCRSLSINNEDRFYSCSFSSSAYLAFSMITIALLAILF